MPSEIDPGYAAWALSTLAPGGTLIAVRGLRDGGAPWLVAARTKDGREVEAVLRAGPTGEPEDIRTEAASLEFAAANGLPVPAVFGMRDTVDPALLLIERVVGTSDIPIERSSARLRALGAFAARLSQLEPPGGFVRRTRSISGVDFDALRRGAAPQPLLQRAEEIVATLAPVSRDGMVHGDLWQGNSLWVGDDLAAIIDWDCSGVGPAGVDLGSLRLDAAMAFGVGAEADVLAGWEHVGGTAADVPYWDVVAALSTPPELAWFVEATQGQGRPDLIREVMLPRRDEFLENALRHFG
jgi:aminoglycoside phosphotransferase (APT) family kinase protein